MTHPITSLYLKRYKEKNRDKYLASNREWSINNYYFKKQVKEFLRNDPSVFL